MERTVEQIRRLHKNALVVARGAWRVVNPLLREDLRRLDPLG
jgi:hypothetical protein